MPISLRCSSIFTKLQLSILLLTTTLLLNGCMATATLWGKENVNVETSPNYQGKPEQLIVNLKENKICIPYHPQDAVDPNEKNFLVVDVGDNYGLNILAKIFTQPELFRIKAAVIDTQSYRELNGELSNHLIIYLFGDIPSANFEFIEDTDNTYATSIRRIVNESELDDEYVAAGRIGATLGEQDVLRMLIQKKWFQRFGNNLSSSIYPIARIDKKGAMLSHDLRNASGVLVRIQPSFNGIKYVKLFFNVQENYRHLIPKDCVSKGYFKVMVNEINANPYYFSFGDLHGKCSLWPIPVKNLTYNEMFIPTGSDWLYLPSKDINLDIYNNSMEQKHEYKRSLPVRLLVTPLSIAADIVTSPFQAAFIVYVLFHGL